ncbi:helix-turn-helix domain-containing protein [Vibrio fortis]|uniref:helix-turn-helix domain-containing protein n=1 Tax=Vibrio fortis TaxID=212667 RepID=UPI0021C4278D|nr:helix-turn-helix domain-containing protein [Vibrio fortis]
MLITMSDHEINRFKVLTDVQEKRLRQVDAADILNVSTRHVRRLLSQLATYGAQSLVHAARGRPSNRRYDDNFRAEVLRIVREHYFDFLPTFALVNLCEHHNLIASKETFRQWMIADGIWVPYLKRKPRIYQSLYCLKLVQIDGSHHDWFEGRSDKCCLLVFINHATGQLMNLRFSESESHL